MFSFRFQLHFTHCLYSLFSVLLDGKKRFDAENENAKNMCEKIENTKPDLSNIADYIKEHDLGMFQSNLE